MNKYILETLKKAKEHNEIVSIHVDPLNQADCDIGYVDEISDSWVRIRAISREGYNGGYFISSLEKIFRIGIHDSYVKKIEFIKNNIMDVFKAVEFLLPIEENNIIYTTLKEAQQKELIVTLWTEDDGDSVIGYVDDFNEDTVKILVIDDFGEEDGFIVIALSEVVNIACNDRKCQVIKFLNKNKMHD